MSDISRLNETDEEYERLNVMWKDLQNNFRVCQSCKCWVSGIEIGSKCFSCSGICRQIEEEDVWPKSSSKN